MKKAALYSRVSTLEQAKEGYSLKAQMEKLEKYANAMDYEIVDHYSDGGHSGSNIDRPAMQRMIRDIESGSVDVVIVHKLDRLSRSQKNTLHLIEDVFEKHNVGFISLQENIDTTSAFGRAMIGILSVFAQLELDTITERLQMGRIERSKKGYWKGSGNVPFGYDYIDGELVTNEDYPIVQEIFERFTDGQGAYEIYKDLLERYPNKIYGNNMITRILDNVTYTGSVVFDGEVYAGRHEAIVSKEIFSHAQEIRASVPDKHKVDKSKRAALLARKIHCGHCGVNVSMFRRYYMKDGVKRDYYGYYRCNSKRNRNKLHRSIRCTQKNHRTDKVDELVLEAINLLDYDKQVKKIERKRNTVPTAKKLDALEKQEKRLLDLYQFGNVAAEELQKRLKEIGLEKEKLKQSKQSQKEKKAIEVLKMLKDIDVFSLPFEEQCQLVDTLVDRITMKDDDINVYFVF